MGPHPRLDHWINLYRHLLGASCWAARASPGNVTVVSAAFEVSPDDPHGVAEAIRRAAEGATVHVVRDGRPVADIVPATPSAEPETAAQRRERGLVIERRQAARFGAPSVADFHRLYSAQGWEWPGDDAIRAKYVVADPTAPGPS